MRRFYLQNETGNRQYLNGENGVFLSNPAGLGVAYSSSYADLEDGFFKRTEKKTPLSTVPCSLTFTKNSYEKYQEFVDWCERAQELFLIYKPVNTEYWRRVELSYLTKTEIQRGTWLEVPSAFNCLTPWYLPTPLNLNFERENENVMKYEFTYDESLVYGASTAGAYTAQIRAQGHMPAALLIEYEGVVVDPVISLTGVVTGEVYGECRISGDFGETNKIVLSTAQQDSYVKLITADGTEIDLLDALDITTDPFFRVPLNEPCELKFTANDIMTGTASAQVFFYYRSV